MKKIYTFGLVLLAGSSMAQIPTNFGSNAADGITYATYNLIDHGVVSSTRFQAQNAIPAGDGTWEFYTGDYMNNWRPYAADEVLTGFNAVIDPGVETASARYNSNYGGQTGKLPAIQAGYYYTCIIQDGSGDNKMSIIETAYQPVSIDTIYHTPINPTVADDIVITVELDGALALSPGEHLFFRGSIDQYASSTFFEVTNFSNGVGSITIPASTIPAGFTLNYYALVTNQANPQGMVDNMDYFTLFFGNNGGLNYEFTVSEVTGISEAQNEFGIIQNANEISLRNLNAFRSIDLVSIDGKLINTTSLNGQNVSTISTEGLPTGVYSLNLNGTDVRKSMKVFVK